MSQSLAPGDAVRFRQGDTFVSNESVLCFVDEGDEGIIEDIGDDGKYIVVQGNTTLIDVSAEDIEYIVRSIIIDVF